MLLRPFSLSEKQKRIIGLVAEGMKNSEIAAVIGTTEGSVKEYMRTIYDVTGMWTRLELTMWYLRRNGELG